MNYSFLLPSRRSLFFGLLCILLTVYQPLTAQKTSNSVPLTVVIDAGHGGKDPGTERSSKKYRHEKDIALKIALKTGKYIENHYDNVRVLYTRKTDVFVELEDRLVFSHDNSADLFISFHCNSNPKPEIRGVQMHIHDHAYLRSLRLAELIDKQMTARLKRKSLGIFNFKDREQHLFVLQNSKMPSVLVEAGFLSNTEEEKFLNSDNGQSLIASGVFRAVRSYFKEMGWKAKVFPKTVYKVQITASDKKIPANHRLFRKLKMDVEEYYSEQETDKYPFKYTVGRFLDKDSVGTFAKEIRKKGFEDAFIITVTE